MKSKLILLIVFALTLFLYFPSLSTYYTNDDFYFLRISNTNTFLGFVEFFDFRNKYMDFGLYRPLSTQTFYFIGNSLLNKNPLYLHLLSFIFLFVIIYLVYLLTKLLTKNEKTAVIASFIYGVSATHFGQLYYLAVFQELAMTLFVLASIYSFVKFINKGSKMGYWVSVFFFILGLLSKENAVVLPLMLFVVYLFLNKYRKKKRSFSKILYAISPFIIINLSYLYVHFFVYGLPQGDTYIWNFAPYKFVNSVFWYIMWSFNLPEFFIDYIGPGLNVNQNLFKYWGSEVVPIIIIFSIILLYSSCLLIKRILNKNILYTLFIASLFIISLLPFIFFPMHKFSFYLTLPLFAFSILISDLLTNDKKNFNLVIYLMLFLTLSFLTLKITKDTHWITKGSQTAKRVYEYMNVDINRIKNKHIVFVDSKNDSDLPWSPTEVLKVVLSDNNFFEYYYPNKFTVKYGGVINENPDVLYIESRQFLGY